ncbi:hypothetical protein ElyMa_002890600 [Elysia marginata]|uniref:Uncharacterized protein n=1 Tax=Elysia marginata TaxID=1093978 RepID=A0AAV4I248_9GAST|nr:hypothetical protein ElyMa_002890600 [Elysia marginata]
MLEKLWMDNDVTNRQALGRDEECNSVGDTQTAYAQEIDVGKMRWVGYTIRTPESSTRRATVEFSETRDKRKSKNYMAETH